LLTIAAFQITGIDLKSLVTKIRLLILLYKAKKEIRKIKKELKDIKRELRDLKKDMKK